MKKILSCLILLYISVGLLHAQTVDSVDVYSSKMERSIKNIIILPAGYDKNTDKQYPVLYLLHGHGGSEKTFLYYTKKSLKEDATRLGMIVVCPNGQNSWYWDSPIDKTFQFETYVSIDLVKYVDTHYKTISSPQGRAITGFSMGGHGGLWLGINHPDVFGACGSMSGGVDICPFPKNWDMSKRLGLYAENKDIWESHTVINQLDKIQPNTLSIIFDCGADDFFFQVNENLHKKMLELKIEHDYIVRPGKHDHGYWNNSLDYQMLYFYKFFNK